MALSEGIKRGTVELLILTLLKEQDMYGYLTFTGVGKPQ